ncbi:MAG: DUF5011 domain-containing protein [Erysipelotrichaceae bacterium]|nr:DUF5011 domain-containing protein [Erysipelotrichaceae bacterium]
MKNRIIAAVIAFFVIVSATLVVLAFSLDPISLKKETFVFQYGEAIPQEVYEYANGSSEVLDLSTLDLTQVKADIGSYPASLTYYNKTYDFTIKIVDTTHPVAVLKQVQVNIEPHDTLTASDLVKVTDNSSFVAYFILEDGATSETQTFNEIGSYVENIVVIDASQNESAKLRIKIVVRYNNDIPTLTGVEDLEIYLGKDFDPYLGVKATDGKGNDITGNIVILKNDVDTQSIGVYTVIYKITNEQGNTIQVNRKVTVIENPGVLDSLDNRT